MKKLITVLLFLISVASQGQGVFPKSDTTSVKAKLNGQSQQRILVEVPDGRVFSVGLIKSQELLNPTTGVLSSRTLTINGSDGLSISGGNTQNLSANRTWSIGISSIDATKIGGGSVSNTEYSYLDGVTSAIQTQLNSNASLATHGNRSILDAITASYTTADKTNLDANTVARHTHSNKLILDSINVAYTSGQKSKLSALPTNSELQASLDLKLNVADAVAFSYPKGLYDAATNTPTLTSTPDTTFEAGSYYEVSVSGTLTFAGNNFSSGKLVNIGDRLMKIGSLWTYIAYAESNRLKAIESVISDYTLQSGTTVTGSYVLNNNTVTSSASRSYTTLNISENDIIKVTGSINGSPMWLAIYRNVGGSVIGYEVQGTNGVTTTYTDYYLSIPSGTTQIVINNMVGYPIEIKKGVRFNQAAKKSYVDSLYNSSPYKSVLSDYTAQSTTNVDGFYYNEVGGIISSASRRYTIISATNLDSIKVTSKINGSPVYLAIYRNSLGSIIGKQFIGVDGVTTTYTNQKLTIPANTASIVINGMLADPIIVYKYQSILKAASTSITTALDSRVTTNETTIALHNSTLSNYVSKTINVVGGFYVNSSGTAVSSASRSYKVISATSSDSIKVTSKINGSPVYLAIYKNSGGTVIGTQIQGINGVTTSYIDQKLTIPSGTASITVNGMLADSIIIKKKELLSSVTTPDQYQFLYDILHPLKNKTVLFLGTSITAGSTYATNAPLALGGTGINKGVGSSTARKSKADGGYAGLAWQNYVYSLSQTIANKDSIIANWSTIRTDLGNSPPTTLDTAFVRGCSFERRLLPYLNGSLPMPDVFVFEHGRNDNFSSDSDSQYTTVPANRKDRRTYIGAMNYLFDLIVQYNPYAKILIIGHYENDLLTRVSLGQTTLADYWNIPLLRTWEKSGFSQQIAIGSQPLWSQSPWNLYTSGQNTSIDMVRQRVWLPDGIHLESGTNGKAQALMDKIITQFLRENN